MFKFLRRFFNSPSKESMMATIRQLEEDRTAIHTKLQELETQRQAEVQELETQRLAVEDKKNSTEPWVEIKSADYDEVKGFRIELDWNDAFIQHLKESGLKGKTEEEVVQKWLGFLYGDLISRLEQNTIEASSTKPPTNDYV